MATTVENLSWTAVANPSNSWIELEYPPGTKSKESVTGTGSQDVKITITPSTIFGDSDTAGTVTFTCLDCNPPERPKVVNVTRCAPTECEYESTGVTKYEDQDDLEAVACDTGKTVNVQTNTTYHSTNGCGDKVVPGSESVTFQFDKNQTSEAVTHEFYYPSDKPTGYATIKITQAAGPCASCGCGQINLSNTSLSWDWDSTEEKTVTFTIDSDCTSLITVTGVTASGNFTAELNGNSINVKPTGTAPGTASNTGSVTISYDNNGSNICENAISLLQSAQGCPTITINVTKDDQPFEGDIPCEGAAITFTKTIS